MVSQTTLASGQVLTASHDGTARLWNLDGESLGVPVGLKMGWNLKQAIILAWDETNTDTVIHYEYYDMFVDH